MHKWVFGNIPIPQQFAHVLQEHAANNKWSSTFWLTKTQADTSTAVRRNTSGSMHIRSNEKPLELTMSMADLLTELDSKTVLPLLPATTFPPLERFAILGRFPRPPLSPDNSLATRWVLHGASTAVNPGHCEWRKASKAEVLLGTTLDFISPYQEGAASPSAFCDQREFFISISASEKSSIWSYPADSNAITARLPVQLFNAEQTENPFALDSSLAPLNPACQNSRWDGQIGMQLVFIAVQMKYRSMQWVEVPASNKVALIPLRHDAHEPHLVTEHTTIRLIHISAFPISSQLLIWSRMPFFLRAKRSVKVFYARGTWRMPKKFKSSFTVKPIGEDIAKLGLLENEVARLEQILKSVIFVAVDELVKFKLAMPLDVEGCVVEEPTSIKRYFVNRDQAENTAEHFDFKDQMLPLPLLAPSELGENCGEIIADRVAAM